MTNDDNDENISIEEQLKNAIDDVISKNIDPNVPVDVEVTVESKDKNSSLKNEDSIENPSENSENSSNSQNKEQAQPSKKTGSKPKDKNDFTSALGSIIPVEQTLPVKLSILGLNGHPIFPGIFTPLMISNQEDVKTVEDAFNGSGFIGLVLTKDEVESATVNDMYEIGTVARIIKKINLPDGGINIFVSTIKRFKIRKSLSVKNPVVVAVEYLDDEEGETFETKALTRALISEMKEISDNNPLFSEEMRLNMVNIDNPGKIADFVASILNVDKTDQQKVLEQLNIRSRLEQVLVFIKKEQELLRMQKKIQNELNEKIEKNQREYFLREEMKSIQDELGIGADGEGNDYTKFKEKIESFKFSGELKEETESELEKFKLMDPSSSEYFVSRNYLELICALPWNEEKKEKLDLAKAYKILERDHYGLDDVKKRILEYLAVRKMKNDNKGSIMILVGPPGVGKTSIGHSIADAMAKPFYRFSVGGMRDEAEIKGHRRTYIGAMPGKILQGLKITKTKSPVFMIDEVDKMGVSAQGDPASALLEVLDPEQNVNFRDNYLDLPFDVSDVFFILTANTLDSIPEPLLDRAEIIQLSGYIDQEKLEIARKYLIPKNLVKNGLARNQVKYTKAALARIAEEYAREAGVRKYEKLVDKIHRKIIAEKLAGIPANVKKLSEVEKISQVEPESIKDSTYTIDAKDLDKYLGKPVFDESEIKKADIPGTCIGLAWTSMGGDTLLIETITFPDSKGGLVLTGQMGNVMKESSQIAFNWAKKYAIENKIKNQTWFEQNVIHLHIPEGATPKDGPSAGITMATTFMSLFTGRIVKPHVAMTGELDLTGSVMPIGGLREKTVAAKRNGIKTIFIPKANQRDLEEIPEIVKSGITFIPVKNAMEVMTQVFVPAKKTVTTLNYGF
ncbi:endopeptidase La [Treponema pectinovorum]|uniref:endopeptidase La n=1 Tax=Treponema pectinovorum TaxID=164 RepID=UPI0011C828A9|nr:endopeptidase La [Treponema pectinovorum]